jgi:hypothetical protein
MKLPATPLADLLVLWGGWLTGYPASRLRPVDDIEAVRCPVLVMRGARRSAGSPGGGAVGL